MHPDLRKKLETRNFAKLQEVVKVFAPEPQYASSEFISRNEFNALLLQLVTSSRQESQEHRDSITINNCMLIMQDPVLAGIEVSQLCDKYLPH